MVMAMHCNLRPLHAVPVVSSLLELRRPRQGWISQHIRSWLITSLLLIHYVTLWPWPLIRRSWGS